MTDTVKKFLQDIFLKVYNEHLYLWKELSKEDNILFMHEHIFRANISRDEIYKCAQVVGDDRYADYLTNDFEIESLKIGNIFYKTLKVVRLLRKEGKPVLK